MRSIKKRDTGPELRVRRALHAAGLRYRLHARDLPGTPDIALPRARVVVLVHGCFWHQHEGCALARQPRRNLAYWLPKLERNVARDRRLREELDALGWRPVVVWECETMDPATLASRVDEIARLARPGAQAGGKAG